MSLWPAYPCRERWWVTLWCTPSGLSLYTLRSQRHGREYMMTAFIDVYLIRMLSVPGCVITIQFLMSLLCTDDDDDGRFGGPWWRLVALYWRGLCARWRDGSLLSVRPPGGDSPPPSHIVHSSASLRTGGC